MNQTPPEKSQNARAANVHSSKADVAVADRFDVSRPAISKHIKILTECGLIIIKQQGRDRYCEAKLEQLSEVSDWIEQYRKFWSDNLDSLEEYLNKIQTKNKKNGSKKQNRKS